MKLIEVFQKLKENKLVIFYTKDASIYLKLTPSHTSQLLGRLTKAGLLISLGKGIWGIRDLIDPLALPSFLTAPFPCYISLQSALFYHGMIDQVPQTLYAVSVGRTKVYTTELVEVSVHHIDPSFFFGFEPTNNPYIHMATPEKALIDVCYFSTTKTRLFRTLPEIELPQHFSLKKARSYIKKIPFLNRRTHVENRFDAYYRNLTQKPT